MESIEISAWEMTEIGKDTLKLPGSRGAIEIISMFHCSDKRVRFSELSALPRSHQYEDASLRKVLNSHDLHTRELRKEALKLG